MARGALADNLNALAALAAKGVVSGAVARERTLPVLPAFAALVPHAALQRGSVFGCQGAAGVSLALALAAGPAQEGAWVGVAGLPELGVAAAVELGVPAERLVVVTEPVAPGQRFDDGTWAEVLAAMIDGFDVVVLGPVCERVKPGTARRLQARAQARGAVLVTIAGPIHGASGPFAADLTLQADAAEWLGLGVGHGVARSRRSSVQVSGRRVPRPRRADLLLPAADGAVGVIPAGNTVVPLRPTG